jgi:hypothetical protein
MSRQRGGGRGAETHSEDSVQDENESTNKDARNRAPEVDEERDIGRDIFHCGRLLLRDDACKGSEE